MAKPTTAAMLALGVALYTLLSGKFSIRMFTMTALTTALLLVSSALLIDGSVFLFIKRLQLGLEFSQLLAGGHDPSNMFRLDDFSLTRRMRNGILYIAGLLLLGLLSLSGSKKLSLVLGLLVSVSLFAVTAGETFSLLEFNQPRLGRYQGLLMWGLLLGALAAGLVLGRFKILAAISREEYAMGALFLAMPHIYSFGTRSNYWAHGRSAALFWVLVGTIVIVALIRERKSWLLVIPMALATQAVTATLLEAGRERPYRQPQALGLNTHTVKLGSEGSTLILSEAYADYISDARTTAQSGGFTIGTPVIDLSGQSPGILFALAADSIGQAWTIGGYPGSLSLATAALELVPCEKIANAWVLLEPDGRRSLSVELLATLGAQFPQDYRKAATWETAKGAGGRKDRKIQELYRPSKPASSIAGCEILR